MNDQAATRDRTYVSGDWYGVIGPNVVVILPPEEKGRVAAVWALADEGSGFDETLDALIAQGLRDLHGFVLVSSSEGDTKVVIRGMAKASFVAGGETIELEGSQATTWVERSLRDVTSMVIEVSEVAEGTPSYSIGHGLVRIARLTEGTPSEPPAEPVVTTTPVESETPPQQYAAQEQGDLLGGAPAAVVAAAGVAAVPGPASDADTDADIDTDNAEPAAFGSDDLLPVGVGADPLNDPLDVPPGSTDLESDEPDDEPGDAAADESVLGASEPVRPDEPLVAFGAVGSPEVDPWIDPAPAQADTSEPTFTTRAEDQAPEPADDPGDEPGGEKAVDPHAVELIEPLGAAEATRPGDVSETPEEALDEAPEEDPDEASVDDAHVTGGAHVANPLDDPPDADDPTDTFRVQDHDGTTRLAPWDEDELGLVRPGIPGQEPAPPVTSRPVARLIISDGQRVDVDRVVVLGRAPMANRFSETEDPLLVRLSSPHQEISATHVEVRPGSGADHGTAVVTDLGSTNGTVVAQPGLDPDELQPGVSVQLIPGAIIDLGDGVTIQVIRP